MKVNSWLQSPSTSLCDDCLVNLPSGLSPVSAFGASPPSLRSNELLTGLICFPGGRAKTNCLRTSPSVTVIPSPPPSIHLNTNMSIRIYTLSVKKWSRRTCLGIFLDRNLQQQALRLSNLNHSAHPLIRGSNQARFYDFAQTSFLLLSALRFQP